MRGNENGRYNYCDHYRDFPDCRHCRPDPGALGTSPKADVFCQQVQSRLHSDLFVDSVADGSALSIVTVAAVNAVGGGWIKLPASGAEFWLAFVFYVLTVDLMEYLFHRAQHRIPALWSMHSLHHSDITLNASTTSRHYWAEHGIKMLSIYMVVGLLFKAPPEILGAYVVLSYYNVFLHMNVRVGFGRLSFLLNSPQYHRLHHSVLPEHYGSEFRSLVPRL
ncbi:sterol desaturase family protein [Pseudoduganella sp. UC29_106]|uniref:sterol desaturase family protein n=1 Tax=Pseudoduganella sp. UC29_106 TaxID=3374553 RepID=UPI003756DF72